MINPNFNYLTSKLKITSKTCTFSKICLTPQHLLNPRSKIKPCKPKNSSNSKEKIEMKQRWMNSLSNNGSENSENDELKWVFGIDPDNSGALAVLKSDHSGIISAQVFDSPFVKAPIWGTLRKRLDARSIVQLVQSFGAPRGTVAYLEQTFSKARNRKHSVHCGGFIFGLWTGVLVASGFSVVPVHSGVWKAEFELAGGYKNKGQSRKLATQLFPSLSSMFTRRKDHGRAEALLIAAYGNGHRIRTNMALKLDQESCQNAKHGRKQKVVKPRPIEINTTYESPG